MEKENKNTITLAVIAVMTLLIAVVGATFAYFTAQGGDAVTRDVRIQTHTTDLLEFDINDYIDFEVTQQNFVSGGNNVSGDATVTAVLTPNSGTGEATDHYYMYLNIESNPIVYSSTNTNHDPELLLQVFDENDELVEIDYFDDTVEYDGLEGYDITGISGLIPILENYEIEATNNQTEKQEWHIVITMINLDVDQEDNTGKEVEASIIIQKEEIDLGFTGTIYRNNEKIALNNYSIIDNQASVWCPIHNNVADCSDYYFSSEVACELHGSLCTENNISYGIGSYETNVNTIRNKTYTLYCPSTDNNQTCSSSYWHYQNEQECLDNIDASTYTCKEIEITKNNYLKHEVENNIIINTEVCLWYNNHEFCFGPNYWDTDSSTTMNKMETEMEEALGIQSISCGFDEDIMCGLNDHFDCTIHPDGIARCRNENGSCEAYTDGSSHCTNL